jgi:hypothetical protein
MFFGEAEANTSAGAPLMIWVASVELAPKLNVTLTPGWAASNVWPRLVKASFSEEAANTVMDPLRLGVLDEPAVLGLLALLGLLLLLDEQAASPATAARTSMAVRRTMTP